MVEMHKVMTFFSCFFILLQSKIFNQETPEVFGASNLKLYIYIGIKIHKILPSIKVSSNLLPPLGPNFSYTLKKTKIGKEFHDKLAFFKYN
jgi:hypothetical protein